MQDRDDVQRLFDFALELDRLKGVARRVKPIGLDRYENSAEHSWHVALLALLMARHCAQPVDVQRVLELLLVHDIPEIECGDRFVYTRDDAAVSMEEEEAAELIFGRLPSLDGQRLLDRWREYDARVTPEAQLAYAADRLMPMLQNVRSGGQSWRAHQVPHDQVSTLARSSIGVLCPAIWAALEPLIDALFDGKETLAE